MPPRDLKAEQYALGVFGKDTGKMPTSKEDWDAVHKIAYPTGLPDELMKTQNESAAAAGLPTAGAAVDPATPSAPPLPTVGPGGTDRTGVNDAASALEESRKKFSGMVGPNQAYNVLQEALKAKIGAPKQSIGEASINKAAGVGGFGALGSSLKTRAQEMRTDQARLQNLATTLGGTYKDEYDKASKEVDLAADLYEFEANRFDAIEAVVQQSRNQMELLLAQHQLDAEADSRLSAFEKQQLAQEMVSSGRAKNTADAIAIIEASEGGGTGFGAGQGGLFDAFPDGSVTPFTRSSGGLDRASECGAWVNDLTGLGMGDTYESKISKMDSNITADNAKVGDVFVQSPDVVGIKNGHTGIINDKYVKDGEIWYTVSESNWEKKPGTDGAIGLITHTREVPASKIAGYRTPTYTNPAYEFKQVPEEMTPTSTEAPETKDINGKTMQWDPTSQTWVEPSGSAAESSTAAVDQLKDKLELISSIKNHKGFNNAVGTGKLFQRSTGFGIGQNQTIDFIGRVEQLTSQETLDQLLSLKAEGGTLGALSDSEGALLRNAATRINNYAVRKDDKVVGYKVSEDLFLQALEEVEKLTRRALENAGGSTEFNAEEARAKYNYGQD